MPKLHLKRTPEEEATRKWRKKQKKEAKRRRKHGLDNDSDEFDEGYSRSRKKARNGVDDAECSAQKRDSEDDDFISPQPESSKRSKNSYDPYSHAYKPDYDSIRAELEEQRFREKLSMAFEDDERLDSVEARFNSFAHVPMHWGGSSSSSHESRSGINYEGDDFMKIDPMSLDEEGYVEWIRQGMYRKTHAQEYEEKERKKAERTARRAQEKALREETERLEKEAAEKRRRRKLEKEIQRWNYARQEYNRRWKELLAPVSAGESIATLGFSDVPWPIESAHTLEKPDKNRSKAISVTLEDLTRDAISLFLFSITSPPSAPSSSNKEGTDSELEKEKKDRKDKLRETFLRFHPDKFEGRLMPRVKEDERDKVRQALGIVVRALNDLMEQG